MGPERGPGRRTHYAAQMSAAGPRTVPIYSQSVLVDVPTRKILSGHGLDDPCPAEFKLRFHVYKKVAVTAGLITSEGEEAYVLSIHVALALLSDLPLLQCYDTNNYIDLDKTLAFHKTAMTREESGIAIEPGSQKLDSSEGEGLGDESAGLVRRYGPPARAEIEAFRLRVASAKPTKKEMIEQAFRRWATAIRHAARRAAYLETGENADDVAPEPVPVVTTPKGKRPAAPKASKLKTPARLGNDDLLELLGHHDLEYLEPILFKAGVGTVRALLKHTCDELFESLSRKHVMPHFKASSVEVKALVEIGLKPPLTSTPPKPTWHQALASFEPVAPSSSNVAFSVGSAASAYKPALVPGLPPPASKQPQRVSLALGGAFGGGVPALTPPARDPAEPLSRAIEQSPLVKLLFARVASSELKSDLIWKLAGVLDEAMTRAAKEIDDSPEDGVSVLELILAARRAKGMAVSELNMPEDGIRQVKNRILEWSRASPAARPEPAPTPPSREGAAHDQEASFASFAGLAAAAASGMGQRHDGKTGEETSASESRMQAAYDDESVKSAIFGLQRVMMSEAADADKLATFKREVDRNAKLAPVLASAFHRRPQGAFAMMPRAIELEGAVRDVVSGARQAVRALAESQGTVPPHAEVDALLKAVQAARLHGCSNGQNNLSLKVLADAGAKIEWLSQAAATPKPSGDAAAVAVGRQLAMTMPFLMMSYAALHPWDETVRLTFDLVSAAMARGYGSSGVASAVKNVLLPFLRALEEHMDTFQKSASATLPKLAVIWAKVVAVAPTKAWLSSAESSFSSESSSTEKRELTALKTEVQTALAALKKAQAAPKPAATPKPPQTGSTPKTPEEKKAAAKAKKERQAARKAAREAGEKAGDDTADEAE